jgi:hypothetical protein
METISAGLYLIRGFIFPYFGWSGTESAITDTTIGLLYQPRMADDGECGAVGGMLGSVNQVLSENLSQFRFAYHKSHITLPGLEHGSPLWEDGD